MEKKERRIFKSTYGESFADNKFKVYLIFTIIHLVFTVIWITSILNAVENRQGVVFADPVFATLQPVDLTWPVFIAMHLITTIAIIVILPDAHYLCACVIGYSLVLNIRTITMFLTPFDPPMTIIPLDNPILIPLGVNSMHVRDLFFSGHTATMVFTFFATKIKWLKIATFIGTVLVAVGVLLQHVHYSIDVVVAPFVAYTCYRTTLIVHDKIFKDNRFLLKEK